MPSRCPIRLAAALAFVAVAPPAGAADVVGAARVIDGDTLEIGGTRIRLFGIDAPERHQTCGAATAGTAWNCGAAAAARLAELGRDGDVACSGNDHDRYGRLLATCKVAGRDIGSQMVSEGLAWAYVHFSARYVADEESARDRHAGLWQGPSEAPWDFRAGGFTAASGTAPAAAPAETGAPPGCVIKGNVNGKGARIYHLPGERDYARTRIDTAHGEAWFCDEAAALAAGFRPVAGK